MPERDILSALMARTGMSPTPSPISSEVAGADIGTMMSGVGAMGGAHSHPELEARIADLEARISALEGAKKTKRKRGEEETATPEMGVM